MAQGVNSTKTPARPSHEAVEHDANLTNAESSTETHIDHVAMESAKRSSNRILSNEEKTPGSTIFSK